MLRSNIGSATGLLRSRGLGVSLQSPWSTVPFPLVRVSITVLYSHIWQCSYYCPDVSVHGNWRMDQASLDK